MSYQQRGNVAQNTKGGDSVLPKINDKRFADVIDYSQPRPDSGYGNRSDSEEGQQLEDDDRNYLKPNGAGKANPGVSGSVNRDSQGGPRSRSSTSNIKDAGGQPNMNGDGEEGHALQLIKADPRTGKFTLNEEVAQELITQYEGNISFVTVTGKYRTGKSFLLNRLLNLKGEGFTVDPTIDACTQGIWIWSKPVYNERDNLYIFFLDTEGSNSVEKSATHDAKIFAIALLMSSYFIYNSIGSIDENSINDLSLTTQLSKNIVVSAEESSEHSLSYYTPKFLWALRDFVLELRDSNGKPISSNQYLENALTDQSTLTKTSETNKKIRQALLNYFKDRECLTFVRPANDDKDIKRLNTLENNQIRPEFNKQINALRDKIYSKATAKQLKGVNLNMRMYVAMIAKYIEAINQGSVPNITAAWEHLVENECREAYEQSIDLYDLALKQFFFNEEQAKTIEDLYNILKNIRDSALEKYNKFTAPIEGREIVIEFKNELKEYIDKKEQQVVAINEELNQANNEELLESLSEVLKNNVASGVYGPQNIQEYHDDFNHKTFQSNQKNTEQDKAALSENEKQLQRNLDVLKEKEKAAAEEMARLKAERAELVAKTIKLNDEITKVKEEEEIKLEDEKKKARLEINRLKDKEREVEELAKKNKELMDQIKKRQNACCNTF